MISALELITIRKTAIMAKELEEQEKDEKAKVYFEEIQRNTLSFLENEVNDFLIEKAMEPEGEISFTISGMRRKDRLGNTIFTKFEKNTSYADGTPSYSDSEEEYDPKIISAICTSLGFNMIFETWTFKTYGIGERIGDSITIKI